MTSQNMIKKRKNGAEVIRFPKQHQDEARVESFAGLAKKLESRIDLIESDLKESVRLLQHDAARLIQIRQKQVAASDMKQDLDELGETLHRRIRHAIDNVIRATDSRVEREELKFVRSLVSDLVQVLSFDVFKGVFESLSGQVENVEVDEFGMDLHMVERIKPFLDFLYFKYWRVRTTGISNIPNEGQALVVSNHSGTVPYDGAMLGIAVANEHPVRQDTRFLVEDFVFHMPVLGSLIYRIGGVRACPENAERLLSTGHLVVVFPEGVKGIGKYFKDRYKLQRFGRGGFIKLCIKTKSPLIPVGIVGAEEIHPIIFKSNSLSKIIGVPYLPITPTFPHLGLLGCIPFPSKWSIHFGKPIDFSKYEQSTLQDEITIHKLSEMVRDHIQNILYEQLKRRRSVLLG